MKIFQNYVYLVLLILCSHNASHADTSNDLKSRIEKETIEFRSQIEQKQGEELIKILDRFTGIGSTDKETFDLLDTRLKQSFKKHVNDKKDKIEARVLSALIRAYASMGFPEAEIWITRLRDESKSRGVRNRAHRLLRKVSWFSQRNRIMQGDKYYTPDQKLMTHRFMNLIHSEVPTMMRWSAEEINRRKGSDIVVYEAMREILQKEAYEFNGDTHLDALAWFCKVLKKYDLQNSKTLLQSIASNPKAHKKLVKHASI